jgi:hypothetical protein
MVSRLRAVNAFVTPMRAVLCALAVFTLVAGAPPLVAQHQAPVSADDARGWVSYLASDELQGRQVFTEGLGLAASYIADHLASWGVEPAGDAGTYFQTVVIEGMRTRSRSTVSVTVNGQTRTFADGEGVTFPRNQGARQTITAPVEFVGYGHVYGPLAIDDYAGRRVPGRIALYIGGRAPRMTAEHNRLINARARLATDTHRAAAAIGAVPPPANPGRGGGARAGGAGRGAPPQDNAANAANAAPGARQGGAAPAATNQRVDFQTAQGVGEPVAPQITAGDEFLEFVFSASGHRYADLKAMAERQEALPPIDLSGVTATITVDAEYDLVQTRLSRNVVGRVRGADPALRDTYVLLGAHYDHAGYQQFTGTTASGANAIASCPGQTRRTPRPGDIINNGADDNASGSAALLALARAFARGERPRRSVLFVWHTGEEAGLYGSRFMAANPVVPIDRVAAHLNIDMVGRNRCDDPAEANTVYLVGADRISTELHNLNEAANASLPLPLTLDYSLNDPADLESFYTRSDHYSYAARGIPVIFFTTGMHRDYHFVTDEVEHIEFDKLARVTGLVFETASRLANGDAFPARDHLGPRVGRGQSGPLR